MKKVFFFALTFFSIQISMAQVTEQQIPSKINHVTVFLRGAQVTREAQTSLPKGRIEVRLQDISPKIDKSSIQVKGEGKFTILSVIHQPNHLKEQKRREEIEKVNDQKESLEHKIAVERSMLQVYKQEENMLIKNQEVGGQNVGVKATDLKQSIDFQRARLTEVLLKQIEIEKDIKKLELDLYKINNQLASLNQKFDLSTSEILVSVIASEATQANFTVSYLVKDAEWFPSYDLRVKDITSPLVLIQKANIIQTSGEDWKEVDMTLSTGNPSRSGQRPTLAAWYLSLYNDYDVYGNLGYGRDKAQHQKIPAANMSRAAAKMESKDSLDESSALETAVTQNTTTISFDIKIPYTVLNDGKTYTLDLKEHTLKATYEYYIAPKLDLEAFLTAKVTDWENLNAMAGDINLFFEGTYLGKSFLNPNITTDTLEFSLGRDKNIITTRKKLKEYCKKQFFGSSATKSYAWEIQVKNTKNYPIEVMVEDQVPVSNIKEIEVKDIDTGNATYDKATGKLSWKLKLGAREDKKLTFKYTVKYPKDANPALE